jgi:aspartate-semialdehyde dehydrogenase
MRKANIAIIGATGIVGEALLDILEQRKFPIDELFLFGSERSEGTLINFKRKSYTIENVRDFDFSRAHIAFFAAGNEISAEYAPKAAEAGCVVIDKSSQYRYESDIPLVIPEVNPEMIAEYVNRNIIASPNCSTIQLLVALKPIYDAAGITRINVSTYQSVSGTGRKAISELIQQSGEMLNGRPPTSSVYSQPIAFNVLPKCDGFLSNGYTAEEMKIVWETQKIFSDPDILVNPTAVRVPVIYGHSEAVSIETRDKISAEAVKSLLDSSEGITVLDDPETDSYPTPQVNGSGEDDVFVGRIREDISHPNGLNLWIVADNVRKGAALNAIQIAEILWRDYL